MKKNAIIWIFSAVMGIVMCPCASFVLAIAKQQAALWVFYAGIIIMLAGFFCISDDISRENK